MTPDGVIKNKIKLCTLEIFEESSIMKSNGIPMYNLDSSSQKIKTRWEKKGVCNTRE